MLGGPAHCRDTYQGWISLYWVPFHATLMAIPKGSHCHWDQISRWVSTIPSVPHAHSEQGHHRDVSPALQAGLMLYPPQHLQ